MKFKRITKEQREEISRLLSTKTRISKIARTIGKHKSSISRELKSKGMNTRTYRAFKANVLATVNVRLCGRKSKLDTNDALRNLVIKWLMNKYSPVQITQRLKIEYPDEEDMQISHESIYRYLYVHPKETLRRELIKQLRRQRKVRKKRKPLNYVETRGRMPAMTSIDERPQEVGGREVPGHWEGDLILGSRKKSAIGTLSERTTRYTVLVKLTELDPESVRLEFEKAFRRIPRSLKKTLTYDQGKEMIQHRLFTQKTKIQVYFAHRASPWERGTNENTNGLLRQYFPKGTDLSLVTQREMKKVQDSLNDRPRRCLNFLKPTEVFTNLLH